MTARAASKPIPAAAAIAVLVVALISGLEHQRRQNPTPVTPECPPTSGPQENEETVDQWERRTAEATTVIATIIIVSCHGIHRIPFTLSH